MVRFRRDASLFYQGVVFFIAVAIACLVMFLFVRIWLFPVGSAVMALLAWLTPSFYNDFITIDSHGIICENAGKQLWGYSWDSIAELRKGIHASTKAIYIIGYDKFGKPEPYAQLDRYFLLGKAAKEALKRYYTPNSCG